MSGDDGIRTHVPETGNLISSQARYGHFDTSPYGIYYLSKQEFCQQKLFSGKSAEPMLREPGLQLTGMAAWVLWFLLRKRALTRFYFRRIIFF